jgi:hypothetical protein
MSITRVRTHHVVVSYLKPLIEYALCMHCTWTAKSISLWCIQWWYEWNERK